jgi:hypothetical protein
MLRNFLFLFSLISLILFSTSCTLIHHNIEGHVFDCQTKQPIAGARVEVHETDWGKRDGSVVWDKEYIYAADTDSQGNYRIEYRHDSSAKVVLHKEGYRITQHFTSPSKKVDMGMLAGPGTEWSEKCKPLSECLHTTMENGVQVTRDVCED